MVLGNEECNITLKGVKLQQVCTFTYLGAVITDDTECEEDIKNRIAKGRGAVTALKSIWNSHGVSMSTKGKTLTWSAMTWLRKLDFKQAG